VSRKLRVHYQRRQLHPFPSGGRPNNAETPRVAARSAAACSIAGPRMRLTVQRMQQLAPALLQAAADLAATRGVSALFGRPALGKG
jgi:hypothetical protein